MSDDLEFEADDDFDGDPLVIVGKSELADALGFTPKQIDGYLRDGMPSHGERRRGVPLAFRLPDCVQWLLEQAGDSMGAAKQRNMIATARKREVEAARLEGRFVDIDDVEALIRDQVAKLQSELMALPARLPTAVREQATTEIHAAINRLAFGALRDDA